MNEFFRFLTINRRMCLMSVVICVLLLGCAPLVRLDGGTAAGVAGYNYSMGKMTVIFQSNFMDTWDGTLNALQNMQLYVENKEHSLTKGKILAWRTDMTPVKISIEYLSLKETEVAIKVGKLGEQNTSAVITEEIRKVLFNA